MSDAGIFVVADPPIHPMKKHRQRFLLDQDGMSKQMSDCIDGDTELRRVVQEAMAGCLGLLSFRLLCATPCIDVRRRSARSFARNASAVMTRLK